MLSDISIFQHFGVGNMAPPPHIPRNVVTKPKTCDFLLTTWVVTQLMLKNKGQGKSSNV